jgi:hypothetical protein
MPFSPNFDEAWERYVQESAVFAQYPEAGTGSPLALAYVTLGLIEEWEEEYQASVAWAVIAEDSSKEEYKRNGGPEAHERRVKEIGDVLWYFAALEREIQFSGSEEEATEHPKEVAGLVKKIIRGDADRDKRIDRLRARVSGLLLRYRFTSVSRDEVFVDAMEKNIAKLSDRLDRGVIKGDGDNR